MKKRKKFIVTIIILIILLLTIFLIKLFPFLLSLVNPNSVLITIILIIFLQFLQVIIPLIPSDMINIYAGYKLGYKLGLVISYLGLVIASYLTFYLVKLIKREVIYKYVSASKIEKLENLLNKKSSLILIFIFSLIPFMPRDLLLIAMAMSNIKGYLFLPCYLLFRLPLMLIMSKVGYNLNIGNEMPFNIFLIVFSLALIIKNLNIRK